MLNTLELVRVLTLGSLAFVMTMLWTPTLTYFLYKYKLGKQIRSQQAAPVFYKHHKHKAGTPTAGGILIWGTVLILVLIFWTLAKIFPESSIAQLNIVNRGQTYLPIAALLLAGIIGFADDLMGIFKIGPKGGGLRMKYKIYLYSAIAAVGAWWFFFKLDWDLLYIPFLGDFNIGIWYIPYFIFIIVATTFSTNETDGLDGLAGGILLIAFAGLGVFAFLQGRVDLAAFIAIIMGALLAFLWFNIPPARFYMGDTGSMSLGITLGIIAMLTNTSLLLPFLGFILVLESSSVIVQSFSKKVFGKKIFLSTPIHHHFEAIGWPETKVVMRFWIIAAVMAGIGIIIGIVG